MKKTLIALAALSATAAFAQSTVTIDGGMEVEMLKPIGTTAGQGARLDAVNGNNQIRFLGTEDLGGGLKAQFIVGMRFSPESGGNDGSTNGRPDMQGETTVGLSGGFGTVRIGRAVTALQGPVCGSDPTCGARNINTSTLTTGYATDPSDARNGAGLGRTDGIFYSSPSFGGLTVSATLGLADSAASGAYVNGNRSFSSLGAAYAAGPVYVWGGLENNRAGDKIWAVLGTFKVGAARLGAGYSRVNNAVTTAAADTNNWNLMADVTMGAAVLQLGYGTSEADATGVRTTARFVLGGEYLLSKRTKLFATYGSDSKVAAPASKTGYEMGLRHTF